MGLLDDDLINECDKPVMNLDNMVTIFIQELFHTDKKVINNYGSNPSDRDYLLTRKCWRITIIYIYIKRTIYYDSPKMIYANTLYIMMYLLHLK